MNAVEVGKTYRDRRGVVWLIIDADGQRIAPITGSRWDAKNYRTRTFQRDGTYWHATSGYAGRPDLWDLVDEVTL